MNHALEAKMRYLHGRGLAVPLGGLKDGSALLLEAAADGGVADRQVVGAAVDLVVAADGVVQRAASPREAVAEELPLAAACASCRKHYTISRISQQESRGKGQAF